MGAMKKNGRDYSDTEGSFEPDFAEVLDTLYTLCWHLWPEMMKGKHGREALAAAREVLKSYDGFLPYMPSEEEVREADFKLPWRTEPGDNRIDAEEF